MNECLTRKSHLWGNSFGRSQMLSYCGWCVHEVVPSHWHWVQSISPKETVSINQPVNQSVIKMYEHSSLHLTDDTNALLHCMKWTSVSVYSSFILSHMRYVSGLMSETLIFNKKNKSLCTNVSCSFIVEWLFGVNHMRNMFYSCHLHLWTSYLCPFTPNLQRS